MKTFHFEIRCIEAKDRDIQEMVNQAQPITYRTFFSHVPLEEVLSLFPGIYNKHGNLYQNYFTIKRDWAVQYFKSRYQNRRCYYLTQSGIEYIFTEGNGGARRLKGLHGQPRDLSTVHTMF
jgi:hypothetical protein